MLPGQQHTDRLLRGENVENTETSAAALSRLWYRNLVACGSDHTSVSLKKTVSPRPQGVPPGAAGHHVGNVGEQLLLLGLPTQSACLSLGPHLACNDCGLEGAKYCSFSLPALHNSNSSVGHRACLGPCPSSLRPQHQSRQQLKRHYQTNQRYDYFAWNPQNISG